MTAKWQAGKLYPKGSMVIPATEAAPAFSTVITNAGFDDGTAAGWTLGAGVTVINTGAYQGTYNIQFTGTAGAVTAIHDRVPVSAGVSITASCMYAQGAASAGHNGGKVILRWYKADLSVILDSAGNDVNSASGGRWYQSTVTAVAPASAAFVAIGVTVNRDASQSSWADTFQWNYTNAQVQPPAGLVYRAVQPNTGMSAPTEPVWPTTVGVQVTDNQVIWEGALASRVVWEGDPLMKSGPTEPTWPTDLGGFVSDNTVSWECISRGVGDDKCPNSDIVVIGASKVFVGDGDIVRYSATANPLDWSTPDDAGYLPTGLQQYGANPVAAMGLYRSNLVVFNGEAFQMWQIDEDPAAMGLQDAIPVGSTQHKALSSVSNDLFFLSSQGVRSVGIAGGSTNLQASDVGMPIDTLVQDALRDRHGEPIALYYPSAGQYWLIINRNGDPPNSCQAFVYTMTRVGAVGAWSRYEFPFIVQRWAIKGDDLFLRSTDRVYRVSDELVGDLVGAPEDGNGGYYSNFGVIQWPWLDFGQPGVQKRMTGIDVVTDGVPNLQIGYDQSNPDAFTDQYLLADGDTVPGKVVAMPVSAPSFSVRLTFNGRYPWHFRALSAQLNDNRMGS